MKASHLLCLTLASHVAQATWNTLVSRSLQRAFLQLSTDDIIQIDWTEDLESGQSITDTIESPTTGNFTLALANDELYAFYQEDDMDSLAVALYNQTTQEWQDFAYDTTLSSNSSQYYPDSSFMTSYDDDTGDQLIYIYGGRKNSSVTNRLLEFDPVGKTLQSVMTSVSPTSFYGASNTILDSDAKSNIVIGGKASSGWVSMFQIAIWEYGSWTFKTVSSADFGVNSRIYPLVLPVFDDSDSDVDSVMVIGGILGTSAASPYVLSLNVTDDWAWTNMTNVGDFKMKECLGGLIVNGVLISVTESSSSKRSGGYELKLYDAESFKSTDAYTYGSSSVLSSSSALSSSSSESSSTLESSSSIASSSSVAHSSAPYSSSQDTSSAVAHSTSISQSTTTSITAATTTTTKHHSNNSTKIIVGVVVPVVFLILIGAICWYLWKRYHSSSDDETISDASTQYSDEYIKAISADQGSIYSWTAKRDEFRKSIHYPHTTSPSENFEGQTPVASPKKPAVKRRQSVPFANPEDYPDRQELSTMSHLNKSHVSILSSNFGVDEEQEIDQFLGDRDVQVLVSSKRRSKLRITNPDIESVVSHREVEMQSSTDSLSTGDTMFNNEKLDFLTEDDSQYFQEILRAFDGDDEKN